MISRRKLLLQHLIWGFPTDIRGSSAYGKTPIPVFQRLKIPGKAWRG
jgi:hypothetical protein